MGEAKTRGADCPAGHSSHPGEGATTRGADGAAGRPEGPPRQRQRRGQRGGDEVQRQVRQLEPGMANARSEAPLPVGAAAKQGRIRGDRRAQGQIKATSLFSVNSL